MNEEIFDKEESTATEQLDYASILFRQIDRIAEIGILVRQRKKNDNELRTFESAITTLDSLISGFWETGHETTLDEMQKELRQLEINFGKILKTPKKYKGRDVNDVYLEIIRRYFIDVMKRVKKSNLLLETKSPYIE